VRHEDALIDPLTLDELELPLQICSDEDEEDATFGSVIFKNPVRQEGPSALNPHGLALAGNVLGARPTPPTHQSRMSVSR
jgi:hypothetical protein